MAQKKPEKPTEAQQKEIVQWETGVAENLVAWGKDKEAGLVAWIKDRETRLAASVKGKEELELRYSIGDLTPAQFKAGAAVEDRNLRAQDAASYKKLDDATKKKYGAMISADNALFTPRVESLVDAQLTALLPQLEAAGVGKQIGSKGEHITLGELKAGLTNPKETAASLGFVDKNRDGVFTFHEVKEAIDAVYPLKSPASDVASGHKHTGKKPTIG